MNEEALSLYRRKHLGYIFQMYNLISNLNIKENVEVGAYLSSNPLDVDELLNTLGLYEHRHKLPNQLSGGQQQRTAIGRAIVKNPDILLCDEPTGALDYKTSKEILKLIEDVNKKYGNTVVMVTHNDATVIGTLRASGYTKGELIRHYLAIPMTVIIVSAIIGNILGYTVFIDAAVGMYYANYSLPTFEVVWNADAFVRTTVVPVILMFVINFAILVNKMSLSPLKFIRRDLKKGQKKKAFRLNTKIGIMHRFRLRIIFQNMPNYITIFVGILLANVIFLLGLDFPELLNNNQKLVTENMIADYQYILKMPVETEKESAEKYCAGSLVTIEGKYASESVTLYGVAEDSKYVDIDTDDGVYISEAYGNKFDIKTGDTITLKEEFSSKEYSFRVDGIYDYPTIISVFMKQDYFNEVFGNEDGYYNGYLSDEELSDIDEMFISAKITEDDLTKLARQMNHSMGSIMNMFLYFGLVMFMLIIYLLSKIVLEKNALSISMTKILGYTNSEIGGLYIVSTSIVVILSFFVSMPLVDTIMRFVCEAIFSAYSGWLPYEVPFMVWLLTLALYQFLSVLFLPLIGICKSCLMRLIVLQQRYLPSHIFGVLHFAQAKQGINIFV